MLLYKKHYFLENSNLLNSNGFCDKRLTKKLVDLDRVRIETNLKKSVSSLKKGFSFNLYYDDNIMKNSKILGEGDYGKVYLYSLAGINLVIKITKPDTPIDDDTNVIKKYLPKDCRDGVIPFRVIKDKFNNPFLIMQLADGDLTTLNIDEKLKIKIIVSLADSLDCLLKKDIIYADLKLENVLYKCIEDKIAIYLGDIASLASYGEEYNNGFIIVPESRNDTFISNKAYLLYTFAVLIIELYDYTIEDIEKFYKDEDINDYLKILVKSYTTKNPTKREGYNLSLTRNLIKN